MFKLKIWWHNHFDFWVDKQFRKLERQFHHRFVESYIKRQNKGEIEYIIALCEFYKRKEK